MPAILYEDNHCLAMDKPAGLLTQGDATGEPTLLEIAREHLRSTYRKPGNVFVGLVHRLDRPTSGVVLLARTSKAASRISAQFREGAIQKVYLAVVEGHWRGDEAGVWDDYLLKDEAANVSAIVPADHPGARAAHLAYRVIDHLPRATTLELRPLTGRSHQLRVQLASRGLPIVGDRKYGARSRIWALDGRPRVALHARELTFRHPTRPEVIAVAAPVPADWPGPTLPGSGRTGRSTPAGPPGW